MKRMFFTICCLAVCFAASNAKTTPTLNVEGGKISGVYSKANPQVAIYKGIPYAAPPVGELRWKKPQPVVAWHGVRKCDKFGAASIQGDRDPIGANNGVGVDYTKEFYFEGSPERSEDCLYLNVYTTSPGKKTKKPVMVWIHGGAFAGGWGHEIEFDGDELAKRDVVLVTINYRLGILGFLAHPLLSAEDADHCSGNYGSYDQLAALKWVKANIAQFGGNPDNITLFGQSAGAMSTQVLVSSSLTEGIVKRAIIQSGGGVGGLMQPKTMAEAESEGKTLMDFAGLTTLEQMRAYPAEKMLTLATDYMKSKMQLVFMSPCIDGQLLPAHNDSIAKAGRMLHIPYMIGYTTDDILPPFMLKAATDFSLLLEEYGQKPAYVYNFDYKLPGDNAGAFHSSDLWFVFGSLKHCWRPLSEAAYDLSRRMMTYWTNFARTGNPNASGLPEWKPCTKADQYVMKFNIKE